MKVKRVIVVLGPPISVFTELLLKFFFSKKILTKQIIIIGNLNLFLKHKKKGNKKLKINIIKNYNELKNEKINFIDIDCGNIKSLKKVNQYIVKCFGLALNILKKDKKAVLFNGPISKRDFLNKKYLGMTEYLAKKSRSKKPVMLIYNKKFSVSPVTTHLPIKYVSKHLNQRKIINNVKEIDFFYRKKLNHKPKFAILGLNPHCESIENHSEEERIITPAIKFLKRKKLDVEGPFSADTFFIKKNLNKFNVVIGMYHDQVIAPFKTLYNFDAINITLGLPFIRVSPDHGPNIPMFDKNKSDASSVFCAINFFNQI